MNRFVALIAVSCLLLAGCEAPDPPQPEVPPELTPELAKEALVEMIREGRGFAGPHTTADILAAEPIKLLEGGQVQIGPFWFDSDKPTWHVSYRIGCRYEIEGAFVLEGRKWTAKKTSERIALVKD